MKQIMFQGNMYSVPAWAKWIARDGAEGSWEVWVYDEEPEPIQNEWYACGVQAALVFPVDDTESFPIECMEIV